MLAARYSKDLTLDEVKDELRKLEKLRDDEWEKLNKATSKKDDMKSEDRDNILEHSYKHLEYISVINEINRYLDDLNKNDNTKRILSITVQYKRW
jgi:hypothetical protein